MKNDWILDVLSDLKAFASQNGLPDLASKLNEVSYAAAVEIASTERGTGLKHGDEFVPGNYPGEDRASRRA